MVRRRALELAGTAEARAEAPDPRPRGRPAMNAPGRDAPLILLIEDDAAIRRMERLVLTTAGFGIAEAADGETALRLLHEQRADAAVLAINRNAEPRAVDTLRAIKAQADTPVIIMSADTDTESRIECIAAGADDGLDK